DADDSGDDDSSASRDGRDDDSDGNRRRRRRGGRGRRRPSGRGGEDGADASEDRDDEGRGKDERGREGRGDDDRRRNRGSDDQGDGDESAEDTRRDGGRGGDPADQGEGESTGRRRRRRRRSGSAGDSDDPPGTVTKVREPRDSATGIKGSTRLEAKRQRRREGREAGRRRTIITEAEFLARRESVERVMVVRERGPHTQIGVLEDGILVEHYISGGGTAQGAAGAPGASMAGNVYLGRVQNVLPSMEAAFVDIGRGRNAVLYAGEVNWDAAGLEQHKARRIENALSNGQSVLVQVTKDPIGHKGARLTSQVSLPGRYLVYVPDGSMTGISRKLPDTERARLKKILKQIVPDDAGVIVRTAAEGASEAELTADVERLQRAWAKIQKKAKTGNAPVLLHGEADLTTRVVRDVFNEDFTKLVVHGDGAWDSISDYVESVAPDLADRLERWTGEKDVFAAYRVDEQIAKAMDRKVWLPSGGSLVIDRTEAMTVIDVNTGKFTGSGGNLEETVTKNNIEAAEEIVRQLRLRDIGGIIVVDFIDMVLESNRELVVRRLVECLGRDRTKHQVAEVTSLGLVQMTRKRVGAGLIEVFSEECEHCHGRGIHVSTEPLEKSTDSGDGGRDDRRGGRRNDRARREVRGSGGGRDQRDSRESRDSRDQRDSSPTTPSGPTPAQIAAAAYAAAVQSHGGGESRSEGEAAPMET
ncbi:Rne/Rng family ribonuclease, partial [Mobilicoccus sp.]|uniref:Rne/Rng family ribonuclease n=1 Tax=Mobilicoccus sp. TaxID=2034349 RepID=UPI0028B0877F